MFTTMLSYMKRASTKSYGIAAFAHFNCNQKIAYTIFLPVMIAVCLILDQIQNKLSWSKRNQRAAVDVISVC